MKKWNVLIALSFILVLCACGGQPEEENPDIPAGGDASVSTEWTFDVRAKQSGEMLEVEMYVKNESDEQQTLVFPSSQEYELVLENEEGEEVFRYSENHMFAQVIVERQFEPGEQIDFQKERIPVGDLPAGLYTLTAELAVSKETIEAQGDDNPFVQTVEVEIE